MSTNSIYSSIHTDCILKYTVRNTHVFVGLLKKSQCYLKNGYLKLFIRQLKKDLTFLSLGLSNDYCYTNWNNSKICIGEAVVAQGNKP